MRAIGQRSEGRTNSARPLIDEVYTFKLATEALWFVLRSKESRSSILKTSLPSCGQEDSLHPTSS